MVNNDDDFVIHKTFNQFKVDHASLCSSYRNHLETKITNLEDSISGKIKIMGLTVTGMVTLLTLINLWLSLT